MASPSFRSAAPRSTSACSWPSPTATGRPALDRLFTPDFNVWLDELPWRRTGEGVTRFELRNGVLCVYAKPKLRTAAALDAFCQRAARIAARIGEAAG